MRHIPRDERTLLSRNYHRRTKAVMNVSIVLCVASCLVYDWDTYLGTEKHVFSGIRPAVRRGLDASRLSHRPFRQRSKTL